MPDTPHIGLFKKDIARLTQKGGITKVRGESTFTNTYTVYITDQQSPYERGESNLKIENGQSLADIPKIGDPWPIGADEEEEEAEFHCDSIDWSNTFPDEFWILRVRYTDRAKGVNPPDPEEVTDFWTDIQYGLSSWSVDVENDVGNQKPVRNAAGDRFQDAITADRYAPQITLTKASINPPVTEVSDYSGTINKTIITVGGIAIKPHCGLLTITSRNNQDPNYPWISTYTVRIIRNPMQVGANLIKVSEEGGWETAAIGKDEDAGWDAMILNTGYNEIPEDQTTKVPIYIDKDPTDPSKGKARPTDPQMLDDVGALMPLTDLAQPSQIYWYRWQRYPEADWTNIKMPETHELPDPNEPPTVNPQP